ncbi:MAG TPA: MBL fold metallo-hydrolase [Xanthobacteraceae bacterium]|nr:MBL fold metallo-hydrolase [Xanthobacteraceae bacterium]
MMAFAQAVRALVAGGALALSAGAALAQPVAPSPGPAAKPEMRENCPGLIASPPARLRPAAFRAAALESDQVRISYVGHSTFLIESPHLVRIATDYNDYVKPSVLPDIVTMNHAHSSHYTDRPEPGIKHVLRGWAENEQPARHDIRYADVRVRNVPTNIRSFGGTTERHGNSIFIYEIANLCIAHLGHLHHTLTQQQLNEIGRIDIVMVPVDGTYTLDLDGMIEVIEALKAQVVIPMHYFSAYTLDRFVERVRERFAVERRDVPSIVVSKTTLPAKPTVLVLPGR